VRVATPPSALWAERCAASRVPNDAVPMPRAVDVGSALAIARLVRRHRVQVVHCHKGRARTLALLASLAVRIPVLILNRGVSFRVTRLGYTPRRITAIVAVSESIKRGLAAQGVPAGKIEVIYSGTDLDRFHPGVDGERVRRELGLAPDAALVTQVGVRSWRGNDDVLDAMARVLPHAPRARLLFVGAPAHRVPDLTARARARGIEAATAVWSHRDDVPEILAGSDAVVDASYAGLGLTGSIREALAVETPVVATALEGMPELVEDGATGLLVPPRNPEALAQAILRTLENPARAKAMARAGRKRVEERFSTRTKIERTEALYRRLVEERGA
jgi:glycosyltransferase involved in cell wall biosynthesis